MGQALGKRGHFMRLTFGHYSVDFLLWARAHLFRVEVTKAQKFHNVLLNKFGECWHSTIFVAKRSSKPVPRLYV
jgi:hypothetical protein